MWIHATRLRDPGRVKPLVKSQDPPLNKVTLRTRKRLCRGILFLIILSYSFHIFLNRFSFPPPPPPPSPPSPSPAPAPAERECCYCVIVAIISSLVKPTVCETGWTRDRLF